MPKETNLPTLHTTAETAEILRTSAAMVRILIRRGDLAAIERRGHYFIEDSEIARYIDDGRVSA